MKRTLLPRFLLATSILCAAGLPAFGQEGSERQLPREQLPQEQRPEMERLQEQRTEEEALRIRRLRLQRLKLKIIYLTPEMKKGHPPDDVVATMAHSAASTTIPLWSYSTVGYDGKPYSGIMVGRSPFFHGARTTNIHTVIVPVIFHMPDGTIFDPTATDTGCLLPASAVTLIQQSPLLSNISQNINGVTVGTGQYTDIFQRSSFWTDVSITGNSYHTVLSPVAVLSAITISPTSADAIVLSKASTGLCGPLGIISNTWFDGQIQSTIIPALAASGVGPTVFPVFLFHNVVQSTATPPTATACCILGYHNSFGTPLQTYSPLDFDGVQAFGSGFTSTMSHEIGEWMDDPNGSNLVPAWGAEGQQAGCQNNLEVGDPLSPGFTTPTNEFTVAMPNGLTYDLQELAFYSWFYGGTSLGAGGKYSNNGTFTGFAKACPPGGTN
jgi:hypothetical protein